MYHCTTNDNNDYVVGFGVIIARYVHTQSTFCVLTLCSAQVQMQSPEMVSHDVLDWYRRARASTKVLFFFNVFQQPLDVEADAAVSRALMSYRVLADRTLQSWCMCLDVWSWYMRQECWRFCSCFITRIIFLSYHDVHGRNGHKSARTEELYYGWEHESPPKSNKPKRFHF